MAVQDRGAIRNAAPGTFANATVTVDAYGFVTAASAGSAAVAATTITQPIMNTTGATLTKGQVVYFNSSTTFGTTPTVSLSLASAQASAYSAGLVTANIANNSNGSIIVQGLLTGLNTIALTQGAPAFVSPTTAGALTSTAPSAPNYRFRVGYVTQSDMLAGAIYVTPSTGVLGMGTANQIEGMNAAGTAHEAKTLVPDGGMVITHAAGSITFGVTTAIQTAATNAAKNVKTSNALAYAATRSIDASTAPRQVIALSGNMAVSAPTNPTDGQDLRLEFVATGTGPWTVTLATGTAGAFQFGTDLTSLPTVATGKTLYVLTTYNVTANRWRVLSAVGGF